MRLTNDERDTIIVMTFFFPCLHFYLADFGTVADVLDGGFTNKKLVNCGELSYSSQVKSIFHVLGLVVKCVKQLNSCKQKASEFAKEGDHTKNCGYQKQ